MCIICQTAMSVAAVVTTVVPATNPVHERPDVSMALSPSSLDGTSCNLPRSGTYTDPSGITYDCVGGGSVGSWVRVTSSSISSSTSSSTTTTVRLASTTTQAISVVNAAAATASSVEGKRCSRVGTTRTVRDQVFRCVRFGKSLIWRGRTSSSTTSTTTTSSTTTTVAARRDPLANEYEAFTKPLPRIIGDRPDDRSETAQVKFVYVVPAFATDRRRDVSGELARYAFEANEWLASQNGGYGLRFDTYQGALDVGYLTLNVTKDQWYDIFVPSDGWRNGLARLQENLKAAGYPITVIGNLSSGDQSGAKMRNRSEKLYMLFYEAAAGAYSRTGAGFGNCRPTIDAMNEGVGMGGAALAQDDGTSCGALDKGRMGTPSGSRSFTQWVAQHNPMVDHATQWMRWLPNCGFPATPKDGERVKIPGVIDESRAWEIRGGFMRDLAEANDPLADAFMGGRWGDKVPKLDDRNDLYFHITSDKLASVGECNSDTSKHPLWDNLPLDRDSGRTLRRSSYNRPDELTGPQVQAVYVLRNGATDRMYDTSGDIDRALRQADAFIRAESGKSLRIDTFQGKVDVMFMPLPPGFENTSADDCNRAPCPNEADFLRHLTSIGRADPAKTYLFFYSGETKGRFVCGGARRGKAVLLNLSETQGYGQTGKHCNLDWAGTTTDEFSWGLLAVHELLHSLGAVCSSAPDHDGTSHSRTPGDIMGAGAIGKVKLDPSRRNYWGSVPAECVDTSQSPVFGS